MEVYIVIDKENKFPMPMQYIYQNMFDVSSKRIEFNPLLLFNLNVDLLKYCDHQTVEQYLLLEIEAAKKLKKATERFDLRRIKRKRISEFNKVNDNSSV